MVLYILVHYTISSSHNSSLILVNVGTDKVLPYKILGLYIISIDKNKSYAGLAMCKFSGDGRNNPAAYATTANNKH